jgi:uncharacterized membrane protein YphA (DoxX/SURF4 family)
MTMNEELKTSAMDRFLGNRWFLLLLRLVIGGAFLYAGYLKVRDGVAFADSIASFKLLPSELINLMAMGLPPLEVILGVMLVTGWRGRVASLGVLVLSIIFAFALGQALMRGLQVDCGCFGSGKPSTLKTILALGRDVLLIAASSWLWVRSEASKQNA